MKCRYVSIKARVLKVTTYFALHGETQRMVSLLKGTFIQSRLKYDVQQMTAKMLIPRSYVCVCPASVLLMDSVLLMREDEIAASRLG